MSRCCITATRGCRGICWLCSRPRQGLVVGNNEPYVVSDSTDYTIPVHGERLGLPHALIEIRQDLIGDERGKHTWALRLARLLPRAYAGMAAT